MGQNGSAKDAWTAQWPMKLEEGVMSLNSLLWQWILAAFAVCLSQGSLNLTICRYVATVDNVEFHLLLGLFRAMG